MHNKITIHPTTKHIHTSDDAVVTPRERLGDKRVIHLLNGRSDLAHVGEVSQTFHLVEITKKNQNFVILFVCLF